MRPGSAIAIWLVLAARPAMPAPRCAARTGAWVALSAQGGPGVSAQTPVVAIGKRIFVFGFGGAIFDPCPNRWSPMSKTGLPDEAWAVQRRPPLLAGDRVVFLGTGNNGEIPFATGGVTAIVYNVARNRWSTVPDKPEALSWRRGALVATAGREIIVWGGVVETNPGRGGPARLLNDGARLDPATGTWRPMSRKNAPSGRSFASGVWTGTRFVVWGGIGKQTNPYQCGRPDDCQPTAGGGVYDPATDTWSAMSDAGAPSARRNAAVKVVGDSVLVWGGFDRSDGGIYDPGANSWRALPPPPAAIASSRLDDFDLTVHGDKIVVVTNARRAAIYDLARAAWTAVPDVRFPTGLKDLRELGAGALQLIVAHPQPNQPGTGTLARVNPETARWELAPLPPLNAPTSLESGVVAWMDDQLIVWGPRHQEIRYEMDHAHPKGCGPRRPGEPICDPAIPVREVRIGRDGLEGGLFRPTFGAVGVP